MKRLMIFLMILAIGALYVGYDHLMGQLTKEMLFIDVLASLIAATVISLTAKVEK
ncbi:MAG: hypothetical protein ACKKL6_01750 [Candidatus Komeilibacteria bacterium]